MKDIAERIHKYGRTIVWVLMIVVTQFGLHTGWYEHFTMGILLDCYALSAFALFVHWLFWEKLR